MTIPQPPEETPITIVGAGPVGMFLAYQLSRLNVPCLLAEQSLETTKWPKMDLTNPRVMEMLRVLGLADEYRGIEGSVGEDVYFDSFFVTRAMGDGKLLGSWVGIPLLNGFKTGKKLMWCRNDQQSRNSGDISSRRMMAVSLQNRVIDACRLSSKPG